MGIFPSAIQNEKAVMRGTGHKIRNRTSSHDWRNTDHRTKINDQSYCHQYLCLYCWLQHLSQTPFSQPRCYGDDNQQPHVELSRRDSNDEGVSIDRITWPCMPSSIPIHQHVHEYWRRIQLMQTSSALKYPNLANFFLSSFSEANQLLKKNSAIWVTGTCRITI